MLTDDQIRGSESFIRDAFRNGIFQPIDPQRMVRCKPVISLACGDYSQAERHEFCRQRLAEMPQRIELHGGGLLLDAMNPENQAHNSLKTIRRHIEVAVLAKSKIGKVETLLSYVDWRCGVPFMHGMDAMQMFRSAIHGKRAALETFLGGWKIRLLFYLHDFTFLDPEEFSFIKEHPEARGFTFLYNGDEMERFIDQWQYAGEEVSAITS